MKNIIYIFFGFFILGLEMIYIATLSIFTNLDRVLFLSFILGLGKDFVFERIFGLNAVIFIMIGILFGRLKGSIYKENWTIPFFLSLISSGIYMIIYSLFYKIYLDRAYSLSYSIRTVGVFLVVEIIVGLVIYYPLRKIVQIMEDRW